MLKFYIEKLSNEKKIDFVDAKKAMDLIAEGLVNAEQVSAFLGILRFKGSNAEEISGFAASLIEKVVDIGKINKEVMDTCGTGGDNASTFNISTIVSLILASGGVAIAKHGNRSISSKCGSADILEALKIPINLSPSKIKESIEKFNFAFFFAPLFHPAFKNINPVRKSLGIKTVFNILGPLVNPAKVKRQTLGVFDINLVDKIVEALKILNKEEVVVFASEDGLDELSISSNNYVAHLRNGKIEKYNLNPQDLGFKKVDLSNIKGGDINSNLKIINDILDGFKSPKRDIVLLNSAMAFVVSGKVKNLSEGISLTIQLLDSGKVKEHITKMQKFKF